MGYTTAECGLLCVLIDRLRRHKTILSSKRIVDQLASHEIRLWRSGDIDGDGHAGLTAALAKLRGEPPEVLAALVAGRFHFRKVARDLARLELLPGDGDRSTAKTALKGK
jgi:hypothetical protein